MKASAKARNEAPGAKARGPGWVDVTVALGLIALVAAIYGQVAHHAFVYLDDDAYVFANPLVARGLSLEGLVWAFTRFHASNWHPMTWLSHMLDGQLFGVTQQDAGAHHLVNVGLHAANAVLLFALVRGLSGGPWRAAIVAGLFAAHPLRVESVAWASERKDVLSGFFFLLTLLAYARYARRPRPGAYLVALLAATLGLLAKPMLVTLPFVLLLVDLWPLRRWSLPGTPRGRSTEIGSAPATPFRRLLLEKVPFLGIVIGVCVLTLRAQETGGATMGFPLAWRLVTAAIAYSTYLWKSLWPAGLAPLYVHPATLRTETLASYLVPALLSVAFLVAVSVIVARAAARRPHLVVGWLWYLGMLVPVIGLLQVGAQSWADRYAYLPLIGIYVMVVWSVAEWVTRHPAARVAVGVMAGVAVLAFGVAARAQVVVWRDSRTLFEHTLRVTRDNWMIENNLGAYLSIDDPASDEARRHLEAALRSNPGFPDAHGNLAGVLWSQGDPAGARRHWETALEMRPGDVKARVGLGSLLTQMGVYDEARQHLELAVRAAPRDPEARIKLGIALVSAGLRDSARRCFEEALGLDPRSAEARHALARWLLTASDPAPSDIERALSLAQEGAAASEFKRPEILATLAAAHAAAGAFDRAVEWQQRALELAPPRDRDGYQARLERYRSGSR